MASLAQLSTSWCRSSVKVPLPFWEGADPVAWDKEVGAFWQFPEPFVELVPLGTGNTGKMGETCTRKSFNVHIESHKRTL